METHWGIPSAVRLRHVVRTRCVVTAVGPWFFFPSGLLAALERYPGDWMPCASDFQVVRRPAGGALTFPANFHPSFHFLRSLASLGRPERH